MLWIFRFPFRTGSRIVLPDVLADDLDIVFCGTAAGNASARRGAYYAGPGNAFWRTLFEVGLTPRLMRPEQFRDVTAFGLGFTDLAKSIAGVDRQLSKDHFDLERLRALILQHAPRILAFTSKRAAQEFLRRPVADGPQPDRLGDTLLFVLPSPSGAARRYWDEQPWRELARVGRGARPRGRSRAARIRENLNIHNI
jgi:TDG/mug DNA glycosylase family protein